MKERIQWVDLAKAFAIFCVVFGHIEHFSMNGYTGFWHRFQDLYCMPLFFFLSGMFAKPQDNMRSVYGALKKKAVQLLLPFLFTGSLYTLLCIKTLPWWSLFWWPEGGAHNGYWFVWALFEIYLLFYLCQLIYNYKQAERTACGGYFLYGLFALIWLGLQTAATLELVYEPWYTLLSYGRLPYNWPFFIAGYCLKQHMEWINCIFCRKVTSFAMIVFLPLYMIRDTFELNYLPLSFICIICVIILIVTVLRENENFITQRYHWIGYIGRHTLDIYVLHYFFLPKGLPWLNQLVGEKDINITIEILVCSAVALVVITLSLAVSYLINYSNFLRLLLLGNREIKSN